MTEVAVFSGPPDQWDGLVRSVSGWTHFHLYGWRRVVERVWGHECLYLAARNGGPQLTGVLPLVRVRSRLFGDYLMSMPFLNYGGPLGSDPAVQALVDRAVREARAMGADLLELRSRSELPVNLPVSHRKITVRLRLPDGDPALLWNTLGAKVRSQVRRPTKDGMEARFGPELIPDFYRVFSQHMRDLGTPVQPQSLFEAAADTFGDDFWLGCVYHRGRPVAAGAGFRWDGEFEMTWAAALREFQASAPNMLLYWSYLERCVQQGVRTFDFGRCTPGGGTHRFKRQWGGRDEPLWWYQDSPNGVDATPSPERGAYAWAPRVWRHVPLRVANLVGPWIVGSIP